MLHGCADLLLPPCNTSRHWNLSSSTARAALVESCAIKPRKTSTRWGSLWKRTGFLFSSCGCRPCADERAASQGNNRSGKKWRAAATGAGHGEGPSAPKTEPSGSAIAAAGPATTLHARLCRTGPFEPFLACVFTGAPLSHVVTAPRGATTHPPPPPPPPPQAMHSLLPTCAAAAYQNPAPRMNPSAKYFLFV
jgi:hypothetical protein